MHTSAALFEALESRRLLATGPVIINEIMYHASSQNVGDEWVELYDKGASPVNLTGWHPIFATPRWSRWPRRQTTRPP
jgi:hypothetical protein